MKAQLLQWKRVTSSQHDEPTHKKPLKPVCLAIARLRPNESTALAMKESHLFPTWWANPQKTSETSVFGNSAASTPWKHSPCTDRGCLQDALLILVVAYPDPLVYVHIKLRSRRSSSSSRSSSSQKSATLQEHICEVDEERSDSYEKR